MWRGGDRRGASTVPITITGAPQDLGRRQAYGDGPGQTGCRRGWVSDVDTAHAPTWEVFPRQQVLNLRNKQLKHGPKSIPVKTAFCAGLPAVMNGKISRLLVWRYGTKIAFGSCSDFSR